MRMGFFRLVLIIYSANSNLISDANEFRLIKVDTESTNTWGENDMTVATHFLRSTSQILCLVPGLELNNQQIYRWLGSEIPTTGCG